GVTQTPAPPVMSGQLYPPELWAGGTGSKPPNALRCKGPSAFVEAPQLPRPRRVAQLAQRLRLDLPDALPRDRETHPDLLERQVRSLPDAEAQAEHLLLARRERGQHLPGLAAEVRGDHGLRRGDGGLVLDEVTEVAVLLLTDRRLERDRLAREPQHATDLLRRQLHARADLLRRGLAPQFL